MRNISPFLHFCSFSAIPTYQKAIPKRNFHTREILSLAFLDNMIKYINEFIKNEVKKCQKTCSLSTSTGRH